MAEVTIAGVDQFETSDALLGAHLESPVAGTESDALVVRISGWAVGRISPLAGVQVLDTCGRLVHETVTRLPRSDVALRYPNAPGAATSGFDILVGLFGLPEKFELRVDGILENGARTPIGSVHGLHEPLRRSFAPSLQPILVTSLGRSGSTFLMRLLGEHPAVVVYPSHPYESHPARNWVELLGRNPFLDWDAVAEPTLGRWLSRDYPESLIAFGQRSVEEWYTTLASRLGLEQPRYFAEKHRPNDLAFLTRWLYPGAKELFLVRDFRDTVCSILAFNRKRGSLSFGQRPDETDDQFIRRYGDMAKLLAAAWRERSESSFLVHYEELVLRPAETLSALLEYLELEASPDLVGDIVERASQEYDDRPALVSSSSLETSRARSAAHRTSRDAKASIGRWAREANGSLRGLFDEVFAEPLEAFGYEAAAVDGRTRLFHNR